MKFDTNLSSKVKNILWMVRRLPRTPNLSDLCSTSELQAIIERERAIVGRHGNAFSLLVFDADYRTSLARNASAVLKRANWNLKKDKLCEIYSGFENS
jgi:hypothetical protein